jgi:hypothetical protein
MSELKQLFEDADEEQENRDEQPMLIVGAENVRDQAIEDYRKSAKMAVVDDDCDNLIAVKADETQRNDPDTPAFHPSDVFYGEVTNDGEEYWVNVTEWCDYVDIDGKTYELFIR